MNIKIRLNLKSIRKQISQFQKIQLEDLLR